MCGCVHGPRRRQACAQATIRRGSSETVTDEERDIEGLKRFADSHRKRAIGMQATNSKGRWKLVP